MFLFANKVSHTNQEEFKSIFHQHLVQGNTVTLLKKQVGGDVEIDNNISGQIA